MISKKKIMFSLLAMLLAAGLYLVLRSALGLFTPFNAWTARQDAKEGTIQIIELGALPENFKEKQTLAHVYGFNIYYFGGHVTKGIMNGTRYYNQAMVDNLENRYGKGWWIKFQTRLDSIDHLKRANPTGPVPQSEKRNTLVLMAGFWVDDQDSLSTLSISKNQWTFTYKGQEKTAGDTYKIEIRDKLPKYVREEVKSEFVVLTNQADTMYFEITNLNDKMLSLLNFPSGRSHLYLRK